MNAALKESGAVTEVEKSHFRDAYGKKQLNYEQSLEASCALLSCFCMDELEVLENIETHESVVVTAVRARDISEPIIYKLLRTPIVCSAADNFIYHF